MACNDTIHIHFRQGHIVIIHLLARQNFQIFYKFFRLNAFMSFNITHHHIHALKFALVRGFEHGVGFAHARHIAKKYLEPSTPGFFGLDVFQKFIRVGAFVHQNYCIPFPSSLPFSLWEKGVPSPTGEG